MAKIIGISGAHGSGKSTLIAALKNANFVVDDLQVSRHVQKILGYDKLDDAVLVTTKAMIDFEELIFHTKYNNDIQLKDSAEDFIFVERTFADTAAYASLWTKKLIEKNIDNYDVLEPWLYQFFSKCERAQEECYDGVVLLPLMPHIIFEKDKNRASEDTANTVYDIVQELTHDCNEYVHVIKEESVHDRRDGIIKFLETLQ